MLEDAATASDPPTRPVTVFSHRPPAASRSPPVPHSPTFRGPTVRLAPCPFWRSSVVPPHPHPSGAASSTRKQTSGGQPVRCCKQRAPPLSSTLEPPTPIPQRSTQRGSAREASRPVATICVTITHAVAHVDTRAVYRRVAEGERAGKWAADCLALRHPSDRERVACERDAVRAMWTS